MVIRNSHDEIMQLLYVFLLSFIITTKSESSGNGSKNNYIGVPPIKLNYPPNGIPTFLSPHNVNLDTAIDLLKPSIKRHSFLRIPCTVETEINDSTFTISCYVDTGAQVSVISLDTVRKLNLRISCAAGKAQGVGNSVPIIGKISSINISIQNNKCILKLNDVIILEDTGGVDLLLGLDVLYKYEAQIDLKHNRITLSNKDEMRENISIELSPDTDFCDST